MNRRDFMKTVIGAALIGGAASSATTKETDLFSVWSKPIPGAPLRESYYSEWHKLTPRERIGCVIDPSQWPSDERVYRIEVIDGEHFKIVERIQ